MARGWREGSAQIEVQVYPWDVVRQWLRDLSAVLRSAPRSMALVASAACGLFVLLSMRPQPLTLADLLVGDSADARSLVLLARRRDWASAPLRYARP